MQRKFLLLQGPVGPFFGQLCNAIVDEGNFVMQVNFNNGDKHFSVNKHSVDFCGQLDSWPEFLEGLLTSHNITDVIMYGDCRFIHRITIEKCKAMVIKYHLLEEGYLRPYWVTYEQAGLNGYSDIAKQKDFYESYQVVKQNYTKFKHTTLSLGLYSIIYYFTYVMQAASQFKNYSHHSQINFKSIWYDWLLRSLGLPIRLIDAAIKKRVLKNKNYFLVPLQLDRDSQIAVHSDFSDMEEFSTKIMQSFKNFAADEDLLVFKNHPLDCGSRKMKIIIMRVAKKLGLAHRVKFIDAGRLPYLLSHAEGVVTINSTAGISALVHGKKLIVLGKAIYDLEEITYQGSLDNFWGDKFSPNIGLFKKFHNYLMVNKQLNGCFYSAKGRKILINQLVNKLLSQPVKGNIIHADFKNKKSTEGNKIQIWRGEYSIPIQRG